ncbi:MAG: GGDEF domain-containing protein [Lachnospiraceae bacterium]|nr:GGDEF domain-containing protein [Lachnospiraceae bacterium]
MKEKKYAGKLQHDVGISIMLAALFLSAIVLSLGDEYSFTENLIMVIASFLIAAIASLGFITLAVILAGLATVSFLGIKIFMVFSQGMMIEPVSFLWIVIPGLTVVGCVLYVNGQNKMIIENALLKRQVEELVMIDPLTNLYNLRSMFMDMQTQVSFAERNNQAISLMVIKLKYHEELKKVLKPSQYEQVLIKISKVVVHTVRLEDRVYAIDDNGTLAIILTTDRKGCSSVYDRVRRNMEKPETFADISSHPIRVEVQIGYLQYNKEEFQRDARLFLARVQEEADYDAYG